LDKTEAKAFEKIAALNKFSMLEYLFEQYENVSAERAYVDNTLLEILGWETPNRAQLVRRWRCKNVRRR